MISIDCLKSRAHFLHMARDFFMSKNILEVDCPILSKGAPIDLHIDPFVTTSPQGNPYYLHSSPEYGMKRLLAKGAPDIYQISHVFRQGESGPLHNPEFTLVEWYRLGFSLEKMIEETCLFLALFFGDLEKEYLSYEEAFKKHTSLDLEQTSKEDLISLVGTTFSKEALSLPFETLLPFAFSECVETKFDPKILTIIYDFPADQSALARVDKATNKAKRFEIYHQTYELANGYLENLCEDEQRTRFEKVCQVKKHLLIDEHFLEALQTLPDCSGVAVGFDRLMMLALDKKHIKSVIPIAWDEA